MIDEQRRNENNVVSKKVAIEVSLLLEYHTFGGKKAGYNLTYLPRNF